MLAVHDDEMLIRGLVCCSVMVVSYGLGSDGEKGDGGEVVHLAEVVIKRHLYLSIRKRL